MSQSGKGRLRVRKTGAPGSTEAGKGLVPIADMRAPHLPAPPAAGAAMHTRDPRLGFILAAIALGVVVMLGAVGFLLACVDEEDPNSSFASTVLDTGWTHYESATEGFSIELPPSWSRYTKPIPNFGHDLKFAAWGFSVFQEATWLYVFDWPDRSGSVAETYFEQQRLQIASDPAVVGVTELREIEVSDGVLYTFTSVIRSPSGHRRTETVYGLVHGGHEYRLVFLVPLEQRDDYDSLFDDIAKSFEVVESGQ
jgi:hypothetical protein